MKRRAPRDHENRHDRSERGEDALLHSALLDAVRGMRWRARRASRIAVPGIHPSRVRGTSAEFTEYRAYRQGDDLRRIDWKLFARSDRAHVRISEERAVTPTMVVLDASASMAFPATSSSKWTLARQLCIGLSAVAHSGGDPVGMMITGVPSATLAPRTRRGIIGEMLRVLDGTVAAGTDPLSAIVRAAARSANRIAIVSDFLGDTDATLGVAREIIASGRDVYAIHVIAAEEMDPPRSASVVMDPEDADIRRSLTGETRDGYLEKFAEWRAALAASWLASGAAYRTAVAGSEPVSHTIRRIVHDEPANVAPGTSAASVL